MLSDDDLARIAYRAVFGFSRDWDMTTPADQRRWIAAIPALRAALVPDVAPLAPGETVMVPDAADALYGLRLHADHRRGRLSLVLTRGGYTGEDRHLDAAGVRALRTACDRFLAAQEGNDGAE